MNIYQSMKFNRKVLLLDSTLGSTSFSLSTKMQILEYIYWHVDFFSDFEVHMYMIFRSKYVLCTYNTKF